MAASGGVSANDAFWGLIEGSRARHAARDRELSLLIIYPVLAAATGLLLWQATRLFTRHVIS